MLPAARLLRAFCSRSRMTPAWQVCAVLGIAGVLLGPASAFADSDPQSYARTPSYERAERLREALESRSKSARTRQDYNRVLNAFRAIYHADPAASKADASVLAVAGLLAEEGRVFSDQSLLRVAVRQYEYLRTQYPGSPYRFSALLSEGEICRHDLGDRDQAKEKFGEFLSNYPQNPLAEQARIQLNDILAEEHPAKRESRQAAATATGVSAGGIGSQPSYPAGTGMTPPPIRPQQVQAPSRPPPAMTPPAIKATALRPPVMEPPVIGPAVTEPAVVEPAAQPTSLPEGIPANVSLSIPAGSVSLVSGIRHWSTPVYTRIAIDLQNQVAYQAARVPRPDRIYFDLYGARLEPGWNGKSVEVIDDGFLKRIRAAQFSNNVTRIVLDVSSVADYSAFLLPNPWRLIIDIHGLKAGTTPTTTLANLALAGTGAGGTSNSTAPAVPPASQAATPSSTSKPSAAGSSQTKGVTSTLGSGRSLNGSTNGSTQEIASLGQQPGRIQATDHPTTRPIAASVAGTVPAPQPDDGSLASTTPATPPNSPPAGSHSHKKPSPLHPASPNIAESDDNPSAPTHEAEPTAAGERSLVRTLGLKIGRIVIDAGHGGHDSGTTGPGGIEEKQVVLDVALRLGKLLKQRLGADVIFTRDNDTFIPLETRTAIANKAQADLFLSIHANSSPDSSARGVETYYLNFTTSPDALEVAARENAVSDESIHELSDLVKKITLKDKIDESREFAADVQRALYTDLEDGNPGLRDRGVKKAPFVVLIGANMPSILAEISFLTNSDDARQLQQPAYRQRIAESLYRGVARYISGLSGVRLAQSSVHSQRSLTP
jgi:N-acetylmuramoyl-L-alanine amidase